MKRVVIATGGSWEEEDVHLIQNSDQVIAVDAGLSHLRQHGIRPDLVVGDLDTVRPDHVAQSRAQGVQIVQLPAEKDLTDTAFAIEQALSGWRYGPDADGGPDEVLLLGAWGSRWDHTLANVFLLEKIVQRGARAVMQNQWNRMQLAGPGTLRVCQDRFMYLSLLAWTGRVSGLTLFGFRYPLDNAVLHRPDSLAISNEWEAESGEIRHKEGKLLIIQSRDPE